MEEQEQVIPVVDHQAAATTTTANPPNDNANNLIEETATQLEDDLNDMNMNEAASEDSGMSSVDNLSAPAAHLAHPGMLVMPTSPVSVTTASMSASDDMIENENEMLRDRVADLEKRVHDQNDEITCLRATLADCLRRINSLETNKAHTMVSASPAPRLRRDVQDGKSPGRRYHPPPTLLLPLFLLLLPSSSTTSPLLFPYFSTIFSSFSTISSSSPAGPCPAATPRTSTTRRASRRRTRP